MNVLITGAGGFIGRHLVSDQLGRGRRVTALDLNLEALAPLAGHKRLELVAADFTAAGQTAYLAGQDVCFHLASAHLERGLSEAFFQRVNVDGTRAFVERCQRAGVGRFVHCSSVGVYGDLKRPPADEDSPFGPQNAYERTKLAGEQAVRERARQANYDLVVVRPAWVYGPGCPRTARLFRSINRGRFFFIGDGRALRHPIYVADMAQGFEAAATHPNAAGEHFIIAGPRAVTLLELTAEIARALGRPAPRLKVPLALARPAVAALETAGRVSGRPVPFSRRSLKFFTGNTAFVTDKAQRLLGYQAKTELADGVQLTGRWLAEAAML
ncbi:MAG: NAD-dependent epimerase/dehydratase family protein [Candidatus Promineifilaceae bacterium]